MNGEIIVQVGADLTNLTKGIKDATKQMSNLGKGSATEGLRQMNRELKEIQNEMKLASRQAMLPFKKDLLSTQKDMLSLSKSMGTYTGTTKEFMGEVDALGKAYKKANDNMINANKMIGASIIQTAGQMMNLTTQAQRITENYDRMKNPLYQVNKGGLAVANTLNKIANNGNASVLALKMLGPNASMKQLRDMTMMINQGLMRFTMVAIAAAAAAALFYGALHNRALEESTAYARELAKAMSAIKRATKPLVDVFVAVMIPIYKTITHVANLIAKFNKAHPTIAKFVAAVMLLIPALTLILSPLAIGIGLFGGFQAALSAVWMLIGPLVTGFAAMMGTVILVSIAIVGAVKAIKYFWETSETFRNVVTKSWEAIQAVASKVFGFIGMLFDRLAAKVSEIKDIIVTAFSTGDFSGILDFFAGLLPSIIGLLVGGIPGLVISASRFVPAIAEGINGKTNTITGAIEDTLNTITSFITKNLPDFVNKGVDIIENIVKGLVKTLPQIVNALTTVVTTIVSMISTLLPTLLKAGMQILTTIITGITKMIPKLIPVILEVITSIINTLASLLPQILQAGIDILLTLINGVLQMVPQIITTVISIITTFVGTISSLLPQLLQTGIQILLTLINGIIQILPQLIETVILLINSIVQMVIENLPKILDAGIQILLALIDGIIEILPKLTETAINLIINLVNTLIDNLPKIISAGVELLLALIDGIFKVLPELISCAIDLIVQISSALIKNLPKIIEAGIKLIVALIKGIVSMAVELGNAIINDIIPRIVDTLKEIDLKEIGKDIIRGLIKGIGNMFGAVKDKVASLADNLPGWLKEKLGIHSPSRVLNKEVGKWIPLGMAEGITRNINAVKTAAQSMAAAAIPQVSDYSTPINFSGSMTGSVDAMEKRIQAQFDEAEANRGDLVLVMDGREVARAQKPYIDSMQSRSLKLTQYNKGVR